MIDPLTVPIQGDISRKDAIVLHELCRDASVVEFGAGGSTILLSQWAKNLVTYDTDETWLNRTRRRVLAIAEKCPTTFIHEPNIPNDIPECDVLFVDGYGNHRNGWMKHFPRCKVMICHDSLGDTGGHGPTVYNVMNTLFADMNLVQQLKRAEFHYLDSNMVVVWRREVPISFVNWNSEPNRLDPYAS